MPENPRINLTNDNPEYRIWLKLVELAREKGFGELVARIIIHDGKITEIRHREFEGIIR